MDSDERHACAVCGCDGRERCPYYEEEQGSSCARILALLARAEAAEAALAERDATVAALVDALKRTRETGARGYHPANGLCQHCATTFDVSVAALARVKGGAA